MRMHLDRLEHSIRLMEWVRDQGKPFAMRHWFQDFYNAEDCGTAACFWGWCARNKSFQKLGLFIDHEIVRYRNCQGSAAAAKFFGIDCATAMYLTQPSKYEGKHTKDITPDDVIRHIRAVISNGGQAPRETA